jgi:hypothetical protein
MSARLTGHVILEIDGDEQQIEAESFEEEHEGLWKYYGEGYTLLVTANLEAAVDDEGNYPTFLEEPEVEGTLSVEVLESELEVARADHFDIDDDAEEEEADEGDSEET